MNLVNFRDLGGITVDGGRIKRKRLLRSGLPAKLDKEALALLKTHELKYIVDFRGAREIRDEPIDVLPGIGYINFDIMANAKELTVSKEEWLRQLDPARADDRMKEIYREFISSETGRTGYSKFVKFCLSKESGAILFHCSAGKDRTGFAAALLLKLLGAADEDITKDYLKTIEERREANKVLLAEYRAAGVGEDQLTAMAIMFDVKQEYLEAAYEAINTEYGSFESYIEKGLQLDSAEILKLKELYLEYTR